MSRHHHHGHTHNSQPLKRALLLTIIFMAIEIIGGHYTQSLALVSDGFHMLTDAAALAMSLFAIYISHRAASDKQTFGFYRVEILAAFANGLFLIILACLVIVQSWERFQNPQALKSWETFGIATIGLLFNIYAAGLLFKADRHNLNIRGALFHVIGDLLGSVGVMASTAMYYFFGMTKADPTASIIIGLMIIVSAWKLIADTINIMMEGAPKDINVNDVHAQLLSLPHVEEVHDLHVWCISSDLVSLSTHLVSKTDNPQELLINAKNKLKEKFNITHITIQIEKESLRSTEPRI